MIQVPKEELERKHNLPRFFVGHPAIAWLLAVLVLVWGVLRIHHHAKAEGPGNALRAKPWS